MLDFHTVVLGYPSQPPKFRLTQRVLLIYREEDGQTTTEEGFITGVMYDPTTYDAGWTYMLATYRFSYDNQVRVPHYQTVGELELRALSF